MQQKPRGLFVSLRRWFLRKINQRWFLPVFVLVAAYSIYVSWTLVLSVESPQSTRYESHNSVTRQIYSVLTDTQCAVLSMDVFESAAAWRTLARYNHLAYANLHNCRYLPLKSAKYRFGELRKGDKVPMHFQKVAYLRDTLRNAILDTVIWIDGDALFMNCSIEFETVLRKAKDLYQSDFDMVFTGDLRVAANSGVFVLRNSQWTRDFVDDWFVLSGVLQHFVDAMVYRDQSVLLMLLHGLKPVHLLPQITKHWTVTEQIDGILESEGLEERLKAAAETHESPMLTHTVDAKESRTAQWSQLHPSVRTHIAIVRMALLNSYTQTWKPGQFVLHFAGRIQKQKQKLMETNAPLSSCLP